MRPAAYLSLATRNDVADEFDRHKSLNGELQSREAIRCADGPWLLVCECGRPECAETVELSTLEYEAVRSHPHLYVVAPGHSVPGITATVTAAPRRFEFVELLHRLERPAF